MKIVFAASEAAPYIKTGGLGDVAQALPLALSKQPNYEVLLFLPYYGQMKQRAQFPVEKIAEFEMPLAWRRSYVGLYRVKSPRRKERVYLIDNEYYFNRDTIYGCEDDGERFAYFSKAILESLLHLGETPDVIHCNDWQTALLPVLLHAFYQDSLGSAKTVFTIHNIEYQGWTHPYFLGEVLGLPNEYDSVLHFHDGLNFMKGAILSCDALTTVSRTYAQEICEPYFAHGLSDIIREHSFKLSGIVNGIDLASNDPKTDPNIACNYDVKTYREGKAACKEALQKELGLPVRPEIPVIGMVSRLVSHKGLDILAEAIDELMNWDIQIVILGTGDPDYENRFRETANRHPDRFSLNLLFNPSLSSKIYAGSDLYLMPSKSEPCGLSQLLAMHYGTIPIVHETGGLKDTVIPFNPMTGEGLGFTFQTFWKDDMLWAMRRALEVYGGHPEAFQKAIRNGMTADFSWAKPAREYSALYSRLKNNG